VFFFSSSFLLYEMLVNITVECISKIVSSSIRFSFPC